jgi:hypothetical protein
MLLRHRFRIDAHLPQTCRQSLCTLPFLIALLLGLLAGGTFLLTFLLGLLAGCLFGFSRLLNLLVAAEGCPIRREDA